MFPSSSVTTASTNSSGGVNGDGIVKRISPSSSNSSSPQNENNCFQNGSQSQPKNEVIRVYRAAQKKETPSTSQSFMPPSPSSSATTTTSNVIVNDYYDGVLTRSRSGGADSRPRFGSKEQSGSGIVEKKKGRKRNSLVIYDHITVISGEPTMFKCNVCMKRFKTKAHIRYHEFCQNGTKPFKCEECDQGFSTKCHYEYHLRIHTGERPYVCPKCGKAFNQRGKVTRHMRSHTGEKPFICSECGRGFSNAHVLRSHNFIHTGERPFACKYCNKRFTGRSNLKCHIVTHTGERPYNCPHCPKSFGLKWTLHHHLQTHSTEGPFTCDQCAQVFPNSKDLRRHLVSHNEKKFKCWICGTAFRRKDNLDRHIKNTHKEVTKQLGNDAEYLEMNQNKPVPPSKIDSAVVSTVLPKSRQASAASTSGSNKVSIESNPRPRATRQNKGKKAEKPTIVTIAGLQTKDENQSNNEHINISEIDTTQLSPLENLEENETASALFCDDYDIFHGFLQPLNLAPSDCGIGLGYTTPEEARLIQQLDINADEFLEVQTPYIGDLAGNENKAHTPGIEEELMTIEYPVENNEVNDDNGIEEGMKTNEFLFEEDYESMKSVILSLLNSRK